MEAFCVSSLVNFAYQSEDEGTRIYPSDTTVAIRYFSILAVIISSIALFGVLYPIITEREKTLDTVRSIGASKRRKYMILFTEAIIFLIAGTLAGFALSAGVYELILLVQKNLLSLPPLRGYTAEWGVERITEDPFAASMICSAVLLTIGYMIYFLSKRRHSRKLLKKAPRPKPKKNARYNIRNGLLEFYTGYACMRSHFYLYLGILLFHHKRKRNKPVVQKREIQRRQLFHSRLV